MQKTFPAPRFLLLVVSEPGLFRAGFISPHIALTLKGNVIQDTLWGACIGSVLSGNPVNSYVIGETMIRLGVSLFGAAALMLTWVNQKDPASENWDNVGLT